MAPHAWCPYFNAACAEEVWVAVERRFARITHQSTLVGISSDKHNTQETQVLRLPWVFRVQKGASQTHRKCTCATCSLICSLARVASSCNWSTEAATVASFPLPASTASCNFCACKDCSAVASSCCLSLACRNADYCGTLKQQGTRFHYIQQLS